MSRITSLDTSLLDMMVIVSDGNPGAIAALGDMVAVAEATDPDNWAGPYGPPIALDTHGIYGSNIWILFKDICGHSAVRTLAVMRAIQLGIVSEREIKQGIATCGLNGGRDGNTARVDELFAAVRQQLPKFAAQAIEARRATTAKQGVVHESAVGNADVPTPNSISGDTNP